MRPEPSAYIHAIDQPRLGEEVAQLLRRAILVGDLAPGTHLVESVLSTEFDVSRGPIRDALRELESEGLVEARRRGVFVTGLTRDDVWELYTLRAAIDLVALDLAVARFTPEDFAHLRRLVTRMEHAAREGRLADFAEADMSFHSAFYERAGHRRLLKVWQSFVATFRVLIELTDVENPDVSSIVQEHHEILEAAERGDTAALRAQLGKSLDVALELFQRRLPAMEPSRAAPLVPSAIVDPGSGGRSGGEEVRRRRARKSDRT
jgi:GntR family transcriptional regulator of gluconate operon